jgi:hypothetical protein
VSGGGPLSPVVVVQVGFVGSRKLFAPARDSQEANNLAQQAQAYLTQRLLKLRTDLGLAAHHFLCGISQVAIGGDALFTRAGGELKMPQLIFLPEALEGYLDATSSDGTPDFTEHQKRTARQLLASGHIADVRVVTTASERQTRFEDVNLEILRASDLLLCVRRADAKGKPGGSKSLVEIAKARNRPVLEILVTTDGVHALFTECWYNKEAFLLPQLPAEVAGARLPRIEPGDLPKLESYGEELRVALSKQAISSRRFFKNAALLIIGAHVLATILAVIALLTHHPRVIPWLLGGELVLLSAGVGMHYRLHLKKVARSWALSRLVSEVVRSIRAASTVRGQLDYLFNLPFPETIQPLLRTLNILHLRSAQNLPEATWKSRREDYALKRFTDEKSGQIPYYERQCARARRKLRAAQFGFYTSALLALAATAGKLLVLCGCIEVSHESEVGAASALGALAIILPVLAVAALSLAASFDLEALVHTYEETLHFLKRQQSILGAAQTEREFTRLVLETESVLLGETSNWASRRSFVPGPA